MGLRNAVGKLTEGDPAREALRTFKLLVETGEVLISEGAPEPGRASKQRGAQPYEETAR